jgi:hypothetical protein
MAGEQTAIDAARIATSKSDPRLNAPRRMPKLLNAIEVFRIRFHPTIQAETGVEARKWTFLLAASVAERYPLILIRQSG